MITNQKKMKRKERKEEREEKKGRRESGGLVCVFVSLKKKGEKKKILSKNIVALFLLKKF